MWPLVSILHCFCWAFLAHQPLRVESVLCLHHGSEEQPLRQYPTSKEGIVGSCFFGAGVPALRASFPHLLHPRQMKAVVVQGKNSMKMRSIMPCSTRPSAGVKQK